MYIIMWHLCETCWLSNVCVHVCITEDFHLQIKRYCMRKIWVGGVGGQKDITKAKCLKAPLQFIPVSSLARSMCDMLQLYCSLTLTYTCTSMFWGFWCWTPPVLFLTFPHHTSKSHETPKEETKTGKIPKKQQKAHSTSNIFKHDKHTISSNV